MENDMYAKRTHNKGFPKRRKLSKLQKFKDDLQAARASDSNNGAEEEAVHGQADAPFTCGEVEVLFGISDKRRRDLDGMLATVFDCLTASGWCTDDNRFVIRGVSVSSQDVSKGGEFVQVRFIWK